MTYGLVSSVMIGGAMKLASDLVFILLALAWLYVIAEGMLQVEEWIFRILGRLR